VLAAIEQPQNFCRFPFLRYSLRVPYARPHHFSSHPHSSRQSFHGARVTLGGVKYVAAGLAMMALADTVKTPAQRYFLVAAVGMAIGIIDGAWRERIHDGHGQREEKARRSR
jgi:hypothetical protein